VVGPIMKAKAAPVDAPWLWTLTFRLPRGPLVDPRGYESTRTAAFAKSWRRE
jgi:hypothetical protein